MKPAKLARHALIGAALCAVALAAAIAFGGPGQPAAMPSINNPFSTVDFSRLPPLQHYTAADGAALAYRHYPPQPGSAAPTPARGSVVLVHGSSASSNSMHVLAQAFAAAGYATYALDMRGHGASGPKGDIAYIGQLEDDLDAFVRTVRPAAPATLAGFSSGGGFVLRYAGSPRQQQFASYLLLSPFLSQDAPTYRPGGGGWASVGIPRIVALTILSSAGIHAFNHLPVVRFALDEHAKTFLTPFYSHTLAANFRPQRDYAANIRAAHQPCAVIAGAADELFFTDRFEPIFRQQGQQWPVTLLPGIGHITLTLDPLAVNAAVAAVQGMRARS
ncbi:MAG TPA: alpha/beta fold hydrolase [Burkholderiales bacterium]|nr:alpha/beta fold hydrolase [Burkholderiales bacterium]